MTAPPPTHVGWCPGALRPMATGDGLILRVKPRGSRLAFAQARRVADVARRFGNCALDLTSRANLQIRGVEDESFDAAIDALGEAGLIDRSAAAEAVRNVVSSPLAGHDPAAVLDIRPIVAALEARLECDTDLHALPAKFSVCVDDGGAYGLDDVTADIRFRAALRDGRPVFTIGLAADAGEGTCTTSELPEAFAALGRAFIDARTADPALHRMRHLVARDGAAAIFGRSGLRGWRPCPLRGEGGAATAALDEGMPADDVVPSSAPSGHLLPQGEKNAPRILDVAVPFGRMNADQFAALAEAAERAGGADLRPTPWRTILVPGLAAKAVRVAEATCATAGFIVDAADPRLAVAACPGAPGCHRGTTPVLDHAARLAHKLRALLGPGDIALHVSGCGKGCAHASKAPLTLVGHDGLYDLVVDGTTADAPTARNLTFGEAERCVMTSFRENRP